MADLRISDQLIINELFQHGVFSSAVTRNTTRSFVDAINTLKQPRTQHRISNFLNSLIGTAPENFQENLVLMIGDKQLDEDEVHVFLATLKAVINLPELQNGQIDRVVETQTVVRQVRSEVPSLDEKEIQRKITHLFVDRFGLFKADLPEQVPTEQSQEIEEYWDIDPNFNAIAQSMVNQLQSNMPQKLTPIQEVNRKLLVNSFIERGTMPQLWNVLQTNKAEIAMQWEQLGRFELECGDNYALLLDTKRPKSAAKTFVLAIAVAQSLGVGLPEADLTKQIHVIAEKSFPNFVLNVSTIKQELFENQLVRKHQGFVVPTALVARFTTTENREDSENAK